MKGGLIPASAVSWRYFFKRFYALFGGELRFADE